MSDNMHLRNLKELSDFYLNNNEAIEEFDSIMSGYRRRKIVKWSSALAACIILFAGLIHISYNKATEDSLPTTAELLETINVLAGSNLDEINNINAKPCRKGIVLTVEYKNGEKQAYLMKRNSDGGSFEMTAQNNIR